MKKKRVLVNAALVAAVAAAATGGFLSLRPSSAATSTPTTATVGRGIVLASVSATGNMVASRDVALNVGASGVLTEVGVKPGDRVAKGQVLARVDDRIARADLAGARSSRASAEAALNALFTGLTPAERAQNQVALDLAQAQADAAPAALKQAQDTAAQNALSAQAAVDQASAALKRAQDSAAQNALSAQAAVDQASAQLGADQAQRDADAAQLARDQSQLAADQAAQSAAQSDYDAASQRVSQDQADKAYCQQNPSATSAPDGQACSNVDYQLQQDQAAQQSAGTRLNDAKQAVNADKSAVSGDQSRLTADDAALRKDGDALTNARNAQAAGALKDQQAIASAQDALTNAGSAQAAAALKDQQAIASAQDALRAANLNVRSVQAANAVKAAAPKPAAVASAQAAVAGARGAEAAAQKALDDTVLVAPTDGTVVSVANGVGETPGGGGSGSASSASGFIVLTDVDTQQVQAGFSEADAARVQVGQAANVSFDALPDQRAAGRVVAIDTNPTVVSNVVTYKATVLLDQPVVGAKPGMTASVQAVVAERDGVVKVPSAAIRTRGPASIVTVLEGDNQVVRTVALGLKGDDATEVLAGLRPGERVVTGSETATPAAGGGEGGGGEGGGGFGGIGGGFGGGGGGGH